MTKCLVLRNHLDLLLTGQKKGNPFVEESKEGPFQIHCCLWILFIWKDSVSSPGKISTQDLGAPKEATPAQGQASNVQMSHD